MAGSAIPDESAFLTRVESLRGIAALAVAFFHTGTTAERVWLSAPDALGLTAFDDRWFRLYMSVANGSGAVVAFFVMSGFVLARSLDNNVAAEGRVGAAKYFVSRVFRIYPAVIAAIGVFTLAYLTLGIAFDNGNYDLPNVLLNMLLLRSDINHVTWSLTVEVIATPLILLATVWTRRRGMGALFLLLAIFFPLSFVKGFAFSDASLSALYAFLLGVFLHFYGPMIANRWSDTTASLVVVLSVLVFCLCGEHSSGWFTMIEAQSAAGLILVAAFKPGLRILRPLDSWVLRFAGKVSYSFYLLHPLSLSLAAAVFQTIGHIGTLTILAVALASVCLVMPFAWASYTLIERPGIALGRRVIKAMSTERPRTIEADGGL